MHVVLMGRCWVAPWRDSLDRSCLIIIFFYLLGKIDTDVDFGDAKDSEGDFVCSFRVVPASKRQSIKRHNEERILMASGACPLRF